MPYDAREATMRPVQDMHRLDGKVAIITGGAGMLGMQHADAIAEAGGRSVIADLTPEAAHAAAAELSRRHGVEALGVAVDITQKPSVAQMVDAVQKKFG